MADNFSIVATGEKYTWGKVPFTWGGCRKLWSDVGYHAYTANGNTTIGIKEIAGRGFTRDCLEKIGITDRLWRSCKNRCAESLLFNETYWDNILFHLHVLESFKTRDVAKKNVARDFFESFSASDKFWQSYMLAPMDGFAISEKLTKNINFKLKDSLGVTDNILKLGNIKLEESISAGDKAVRAYVAAFADAWDINDGVTKNVINTPKDSISIADKICKIGACKASENLVVVDEAAKNINSKTFENFAATDKLCKSNTAALTDGFVVADKAHKNINQFAKERTIISDKVSNAGSHKLYEQVALADVCNRRFMALRGFNESVKLETFARKAVGQLTSEAMVIAERHNANIKTPKFEKISTADNFNRRASSFRNWEEAASLADFAFKSISINLLETAMVRDAYIKACEAVLSNLYIGKTALTASGFEKLANTPGGYETFIEFKVGEYEYKDALVRVQMQSKMPQLSPTAADIVMHVDIPDTDDRGTAYISDTEEATKIYFNKHYYTPPEVNVVVRGGSTGSGIIVPYIISTDKEDSVGRYFEVELIDSGGERTTGTISWVSKGY